MAINNNTKNIIDKFSKVRVYKEKGKFFLHKPLLLLYALGRCYQNRERLMPFSEVDEYLYRSFEIFYPEGNEFRNTHYPFGKLENDEIWEVVGSKSLSRTSVGHLFRGELFDKNVHGGFTQEIYSQLVGNKDLIAEIANIIIDMYLNPQRRNEVLGFFGIVQGK